MGAGQEPQSFVVDTLISGAGGWRRGTNDSVLLRAREYQAYLRWNSPCMDFGRHTVLRILLERRGGITVITIVISIENT